MRTKDRILRLPANVNGKDYVVGDIHGCQHELIALMDHVKFNPVNDRLISVGDIIDRGPFSMQMLEMMNEPWFYCVAGNHEDMMITAMKNDKNGGYPATMWQANGGDWALGDKIDLAILKTYYARRLESLPWIIHVDGQGTAKFNVVHAELIANEPLSDDNLETVVYKEEQLLWGRKYIYDPQRWLSTQHFMQTNELSLVYCGHTPVTSPRPFLRQLCIDTGCCYAYPDKFDDTECLTLVCPSDGQSYRCYPSDMRVEQVDLREMINSFYKQTDFYSQ